MSWLSESQRISIQLFRVPVNKIAERRRIGYTSKTLKRYHNEQNNNNYYAIHRTQFYLEVQEDLCRFTFQEYYRKNVQTGS